MRSARRPGTRPGGGDADETEDTSDDAGYAATTADRTAGMITPGRVAAMIDSAIRLEGRRAQAQVEKLRRRHPRDTPVRLLARLERRYVRTVARLGGAVGASATLPVVGTAAAIGLTGAQVAAFIDASARYVLAVAEVHGVHLEDAERRRTLLLASLLGEEGSRIVAGRLGPGSLQWARTALANMPGGTVSAVNRALSRRLLRVGAQGSARAFFGRLVPFGIGAVIGYRGTRAMGREVVTGARTAFGPPPGGWSGTHRNA